MRKHTATLALVFFALFTVGCKKETTEIRTFDSATYADSMNATMDAQLQTWYAAHPPAYYQSLPPGTSVPLLNGAPIVLAAGDTLGPVWKLWQQKMYEASIHASQQRVVVEDKIVLFPEVKWEHILLGLIILALLLMLGGALRNDERPRGHAVGARQDQSEQPRDRTIQGAAQDRPQQSDQPQVPEGLIVRRVENGGDIPNITDNHGTIIIVYGNNNPVGDSAIHQGTERQ